MQASRATRHLRLVLIVAALGLLAALSLLQTPQARAVEPRANVTLIKNFDQGGGSNQSVSGFAQRFTTGSAAAGYRLSSVEVKFVSGDDFNLSVCTVASDNTPTDTCWDFTAPSSFTANSTLSFTAPSNTNLIAGTSYSVVLEPKVSSTTFNVEVTSNNEEDTGGANGWSIADGSHYLSGTTWTSQSNKVRIKVNGAVLNSEPEFDESPPVTRSVSENVAGGTAIGAPVSASDGDNDTLHYSLSGMDASSFTIVSASGQIQTKSGTTYNHESKDSYNVTVNVRDNKDEDGDTDSANDASIAVTVEVVDLDEPATVSFSPSSGPYKEGEQISATVADQDDGFSVDSYQWARGATLGGSFADITGATSAAYTLTADDINNFLRVTVQYDDTFGMNKQISQTTDSQVVQGNADPEFSSDMVSRSIAENTASNMNIGAPVSTTDDDGDTLDYRLTGTDAASFSIGTNDGQLRVANGAALDFETKRTLRVTVEVSDGANSLGDPDSDAIDDRQSVTITLTDVNEAPVVTGDGSPSVAENLNRAVATYTGTDPERDMLTWSVSGSTFWISQRGQLHFATPPSYEDGTSYTVTITAEDEKGLSDSLFVSVAVTDVEEEGVVTIEPKRGWDGTSFQAELVDDDGVVAGSVGWKWQRSSNRSSWGDISGATSSSYTAGADDIGQYLQAIATYEDDRGSGKEASAAVTGRIEDSNDRPSSNNDPAFTETGPERAVGQGTAAGRNIGAPVRATDDDSDDILTYSLGGSDAGLFDIDPATGQLKTLAVLDYDPDGTNTYEVEVRVHDDFNSSYSPSTSVDATISVAIVVTQVAQQTGGGGGGGGSSGGSGGGAVVVQEPPAPRFIEGSSTRRYMPANARPGDAAGKPVVATHPFNFTYTYSLSGDGAAEFTVDEDTGQIRLGQTSDLEEGERITFTVIGEAAWLGGVSISVDIQVTIVIIEPEPAARRYDLDGNGLIEKEEALKAVSDYFAGLIGKVDVLEVVSLYFVA